MDGPIKFKNRFRAETDNWSLEGTKITSKETLTKIQDVIENDGPVLIEHWFYCGSSAPDRFVLNDYEDFLNYLQEKAFAGDHIYVWNLGEILNDHNIFAHGKCPDENGLVPERGAY